MILRETLETQMDLTYHVPKPAIGASAYLSSNQLNIPNSTWTKVDLDTESFDYGGNFANGKFTCPVDGTYWFSVSAGGGSVSDTYRFLVALAINGTARTRQMANQSGGQYLSANVSNMKEFSAGNYLELYVWHSDTGDDVDIIGTNDYTFLTVWLMRT